jgi:hypothetical protein
MYRAKKSISLSGITGNTKHYADQCFQLVTAKRTVVLVADNEQERDKWVQSLEAIRSGEAKVATKKKVRYHPRVLIAASREKSGYRIRNVFFPAG